jgi:uncharacterized protein YndB with AHSA1/START domain
MEAPPVPDVNAMVYAQGWETLSVTPPPIVNTIIVDGTLDDAWALWTDENRMPEFMGFDAKIEAEVGGAYQVIFVEGADSPLKRGNDGRIVAMQEKRMLSFTWMTPMHMADLSGNSTLVTLYFTPIDGGKKVQVDLINTGYGLNEKWREAYAYNVRGWDRVLAHFEYAMENGPIDWVQRAQDLRRDGTLPMWREYRRKVLRGEDPWKR